MQACPKKIWLKTLEINSIWLTKWNSILTFHRASGGRKKNAQKICLQRATKIFFLNNSKYTNYTLRKLIKNCFEKQEIGQKSHIAFLRSKRVTALMGREGGGGKRREKGGRRWGWWENEREGRAVAMLVGEWERGEGVGGVSKRMRESGRRRCRRHAKEREGRRNRHVVKREREMKMRKDEKNSLVKSLHAGFKAQKFKF